MIKAQTSDMTHLELSPLSEQKKKKALRAEIEDTALRTLYYTFFLFMNIAKYIEIKNHLKQSWLPAFWQKIQKHTRD